MDLPYQKRPMKRGQCRFCPEINPKFKDYLLHEATHRVKKLKEDPPPEVTKEPGKQVINKEPDNVDVKQISIEPRVSNAVKIDEPTDAGNGESSNSTPKNFGAKLADSRMKKIPAKSHMDLEAEIKERIRNYDWTKDFQAIEKNDANSRRKVAYICKICSRSNVRKDRLLLHTFIHTGERPFHCKICPKTFTFPYAREMHEFIHTGKRAYKCHNCCKDFTNPRQLSRHKKTHFSMKHKKNVQTRIKANLKGGVTRDVILCLDRVDQIKEHTHLYSQALKRLNNSPPEGIQEEIGIGNGMDLDALAEIMCPELTYKCILCSERFGDPMELANHRKNHFSNGVGPRNDTTRKDENEIRLTRSKAKNNIESKSKEIEIPVNSLEIIMQTETHPQPVDPHGSDESLGEATHPFPEVTLSIPTTKMIFGPRLPIRRMELRVRKSTISGNSQVDPDAEIKERIRSYDWTKDFRKISTKDGKVAYKCKICPFRKRWLLKWQLLHHTFVHTGERPWQCGQCLKTFKYSSHRKEHVTIIHTGQRPYKCSQCSKGFTSSSHRSRHMKSSCPKDIINNKTNLFPIKNEILQEIPKTPDFSACLKFGCTQKLEISLYRVDKVKEHMDLYTRALERLQKNSEMEDMGKSHPVATAKPGKLPKKPITTESIIRKYFKKTKDGKFECLQCHQRVKYPREHRFTHVPSKQIPCNICRKVFKNQPILNRHMKRVHLGIKRSILKVTCRFCNKKMDNYDLKDHEDSHRGIKRHICSICSKGFTFRGDCRKHLMKHAGNDHGINGRSVQEEPLPLRVQPPEIKRQVEAFTEEELLEIDEALT